MKGKSRPSGRTVKPTPQAVYRKRLVKNEPDDIPGSKPRRKPGYPKGFI